MAVKRSVVEQIWVLFIAKLTKKINYNLRKKNRKAVYFLLQRRLSGYNKKNATFASLMAPWPSG